MNIIDVRNITMADIEDRIKKPIRTSYCALEFDADSFGKLYTIQVKMEVPKVCVQMLEGMASNCAYDADEIASKMLCDTIFAILQKSEEQQHISRN
jgi:hypothetical protein